MGKIILPNKETTADVVILANGVYPGEGSIARAILDNAKRVVCCDGAADKFAENGGVATIIIGDGDSIISSRHKNYIYIGEQESNDLTKAFRYCLSQGWTNIIICGATGLREDHMIANISLMAEVYAYQAEQVFMISDFGVFAASNGKAVYETRAGEAVSIFTSRKTTTVRAEGLKYAINGDQFPMLWQGTLNEAIGSEVLVTSNGYIVVYRAF